MQWCCILSMKQLFVVETDAFDYMLTGRLVAFFLRILNASEQKYSVIGKETYNSRHTT